MAVKSNMLVVLRSALTVHIVRIPRHVRPDGGYAVDTPVRINAKLGITKPLRNLMRPQRAPVWSVDFVHAIAFPFLFIVNINIGQSADTIGNNRSPSARL